MRIISSLATWGNEGAPQGAIFGAWLFISLMSVGVVVVSLGVYIAQSMNLAVGGFAIVGIGAVVGGGFVVRNWVHLKVRLRIFGAGILVTGLYMLIAIAKWTVATGRVG
jgi:hypothetical protein